MLRRLPNGPLLHRPHSPRNQPSLPRHHGSLFPPYGRHRLHILHVRRQDSRTLQHQIRTSHRHAHDDGITHPRRPTHLNLHILLGARPPHLSPRRRRRHNRILFLHDNPAEQRPGERQESLRRHDQYRVSDWERRGIGARERRGAGGGYR